MIKSLRIIDGFAKDLPGLFERDFSFAPGLTILWGENASGKSTILKILAAYCGIENGGWSDYHDPLKFSFGSKDKPFPERFCGIAPGKCKAEVDWDGSPSFFLNIPAGYGKSGYIYDSPKDSPDGITDIMEQIGRSMNSLSTGQNVLRKFLKIGEMLSNPPVLDRDMPMAANSVWEKNWEDQRNYFKSLPADGSMTILMDEPDSGLSIPNEHSFWKHIIPDLLKKHQVIISTHSRMVFNLPIDFNVIELTPNYWRQCSEIMSEQSKGNAPLVDSQDPDVFSRAVKSMIKAEKKKMKEENDTPAAALARLMGRD